MLVNHAALVLMTSWNPTLSRSNAVGPASSMPEGETVHVPLEPVLPRQALVLTRRAQSTTANDQAYFWAFLLLILQLLVVLHNNV